MKLIQTHMQPWNLLMRPMELCQRRHHGIYSWDSWNYAKDATMEFTHDTHGIMPNTPPWNLLMRLMELHQTCHHGIYSWDPWNYAKHIHSSINMN